MKTLVLGKIFNPLSQAQWEYFEQGALVIDAGGRIEAIGDYRGVRDTPGITVTKDFSGQLILPGLVDLHTHLPQLPIRGKAAGALLEWLNRYAFPIEREFAHADYAASLSQLFFDRLKANGTTTALVLSSIHEESTHRAFDSAQKSGMRVVMGKVMMDQHGPDDLLESVKDSIDSSIRLAQAWHGASQDRLRYAFTPRFALSCSQEMLEAAGDLCKRFPNSYIHSHLSENSSEVEQVETLYGHRYSYTQIYEKTGCLGSRSILAHGLHLNPDEFALLRETQTRVAHCPTSNFFLKSGFFNLSAYQDLEIPFGLGTDIGAGPDICLLRVMRGMDEMQARYHRAVHPMEALYYGTLGGARALSMENETGNLMPGKSADFIVVDTQSLALQQEESPIEEVVSQLVYLGGANQIAKTFVRGEEIYSRRAPEENRTLQNPGPFD